MLAAQRLQKDNQVNVNLYLVSMRVRVQTSPAAISIPVGNVSFCYKEIAGAGTPSVLGDALGKMQGEMDTIEHVAREEIDRQFRLDLKTLYKSAIAVSSPTSSPKSIREKPRESAETTRRKIEESDHPEV
jgi:hypothetical protein